jgi:GNAT superfamily N-acetyltransferase
MLHPHDPAAPLGEVVSCHCAAEYVLVPVSSLHREERIEREDANVYKAAAVGTVHQRKDGPYRKVAEGKWEPVPGKGRPKAEPPELKAPDLKGDFEALRGRWGARGVTLDVYPNERTKTASVTIKVDPRLRGRGLATAAMEDAVRQADLHGVRLELSPTSEWGSSKARLTEFYRRFGFVENKGRSKDFTTSETMYRPVPDGKGT